MTTKGFLTVADIVDAGVSRRKRRNQVLTLRRTGLSM